MDKIEVTQADRLLVADMLDEVSNLLDHNGIGQVADLIRDGEYDEHDCVKIAARHRLATRTDATPVAWDDLANAIRMELIFFRDGAVFDAQVKNETDILMQLVRAFVDPPATDVAALVEAAKETNAALERDGDPAFAHLILANKAALAPFTKGQNDE